MDYFLLVLPLLIPLLTAILALWLRPWPRAEQAASVAGSVALLGAALALLARVWQGGILVGQMGNWPAPFGITLVADLLGAIMVLLAAGMGLASGIYSLASVDEARQRHFFHPLFHVLLLGVCGAFLTGDLFNLYVWFEVMLIASFVLIALGGTRPQLEGAMKYVTLNLFSSAIFLAAVGLIYGVAGTLNLADLAVQLAAAPPPLVSALAMLLLLAFGIKAGLVPLFFWLPASYHTAPVAVSALFAGLLTKVGVYALIRVFTLIFVQEIALTHTLLLALAGLTMVVGVLGAAVQGEIRRILSFHIVSQIGYMVMGLALFTPLALAGAIFYLIHHIIVKTSLFLIGGVVRHLHGTEVLARLGGLYGSRPLLAALFLIPALSLAGLPPFSGFWAKLLLIQGGLEAESYGIVAAALAVSLLTLFSMTKIWGEAFWKGLPEGSTVQPLAPRAQALLLAPIVALVALSVSIGLAAEPIFQLSMAAAEQLLDPAHYVAAVLGEEWAILQER